MQIFCQLGQGAGERRKEWQARGGVQLLAVEPISSHFSRLTYENLNLRMQNGSWTRQRQDNPKGGGERRVLPRPPTLLPPPLRLPPERS